MRALYPKPVLSGAKFHIVCPMTRRAVRPCIAPELSPESKQAERRFTSWGSTMRRDLACRDALFDRFICLQVI
jgi:hypothetical protein